MSDIPRDWDDEVVDQYLTPESQQKTREQFLETHIDIDKIRADYLSGHPGSDEYVTQEEFRDAILKSSVRDDNRIFILRGETGSGKSQLCQWLDYQIGEAPEDGEDDTHVALHVSRSETRISDIIEILTEPIDYNITISDVEDLDPEKVADAIITSLEAFAPTYQDVSESEIEALIKDRPNGIDLRGILVENIQKYQTSITTQDEGSNPIQETDADEAELVTELIDEDDYRQLSFQAYGNAKGSDSLFPTLQGRIHGILSDNIGVGDFQAHLEDISEEYADSDLRPVLICEDLTTFTVLKEQLLDHIFELSSGHYDVVLGWTTGWETEELDRALGVSENTYTYMEERAEGYLSTTNEEGEAYFLTEDVTVELTRKYVSVIREKSTARTDVDIPEEAFDGLYPFNQEFVRRSYEHLVRDGSQRRTPRLLLIRIIKECLKALSPPAEAIDGNPYVKQFPTPISLDYPADVQRLVKWYGIPTLEDDLTVPLAIFETFDISPPEGRVQDGEVVFSSGVDHDPTLSLSLKRGAIDPGSEIEVLTEVDGRPEEGVEIAIDGEVVGITSDDGLHQISLPDEERMVTISAWKNDLSDELTVEIGMDDLRLQAAPRRPDANEEFTVTARFNGDPVEGVDMYRDGEHVGQTDADGEIDLVATDGSDIELSAEYEGVEDSLTVSVRRDRIFPVETDLDPDEVDQRTWEYERWVTNGEEYPSSATLREGATEILEGWHDPTELANANASVSDSDIHRIYYARGTNTPISLVGADERQGLSVELPFGSEHDDVYRALFWTGISENGALPHEDRYALNYDTLRAWADNKTAEFRSEMRAEIEACLPDGWTIEQFVVLGQLLLRNARTGEIEFEPQDVLQPTSSPEEYESPIQKRFDPNHGFYEAYDDLTMSSSQLHGLAMGFFLIKENLVDADRLERAFEAVTEDFSGYVGEAMYIDTADLDDAFRTGSSRSSASMKLDALLDRVKNYAQELDALTGTQDANHISTTVETIDEWFDESHSVPELQDQFAALWEAANTLDAGDPSRWGDWEDARSKLEDEQSEINFHSFKDDVTTFRDVSAIDGINLLSVLHQFERSREERPEWELYKAINEMIEEAEGINVDDGDGGEYENRLRELDEFQTARTKQQQLFKKARGDQ